MAYNRNLLNLFNGYTNYEVDPPDKEAEPAKGTLAPPSGYTPSTPEQRKNWNTFLDFLAEKKVGGSPELDKRDKQIGLTHLREYNKANPKAQIPESFIPIVQYESQLIRKQGKFPGLNNEEAKYAFGALPAAYKQRPISEVDNWLGSYTSKQYYPNFSRGSSKNTPTGENVTTGQYDFGVNFEDYVRSLKDSKLQEKYKSK